MEYQFAAFEAFDFGKGSIRANIHFLSSVFAAVQALANVMNDQKETLPLLAMATLGVVFGDIGTSPLYTLSACLSAMSLPPTAANLQGILSLIFWTLVLVVSGQAASSAYA